MSKSHMVYVAVLIVALLVLLWDKTSNDNSVTSPKPSLASTSAGSPPMSTVGHNIGVGSAGESSPAVSQIGGGHSGPGAVPGPLGLWRSLASTASALSQPQSSSAPASGRWRDLFAAPEPPEPVSDDVSMTLGSTLHLTATLQLRGSDTASINGKTVSVGENIGPYRLVEVHRDFVILESDGRWIKLFMDQ